MFHWPILLQCTSFSASVILSQLSVFYNKNIGSNTPSLRATMPTATGTKTFQRSVFNVFPCLNFASSVPFLRQHKVAPSVFTSADHRGSFIHSRPRYYRGRLHCAHCVHDAQQLQNDFDCKFKEGFHFFPFLCINNHQKCETRHSLRQLVDAQNQFQCSVHGY